MPVTCMHKKHLIHVNICIPARIKVYKKMGKESKKSGGGGKGEEDESIKYENYLYGVIVADIDEKAFDPISAETPKVLLPLNGSPILNYSFEFLCKNGVRHVYILTKQRHSSAIQQHVSNYMKKKKDKSFSAECLQMSESVESVGDALREFDSLRDIRHDFILMLGDSFSVADIRVAISEHKKRNQTNSDQILTKIFAYADPKNSVRQKSDDAVVVYDEQTSEMVAYETFSKRQKSISLNDFILQRNSRSGRVRVRYDLLDPFILICSPKVLKLLSESFDYMHINEDFIYSILHKELKMEEIYVYVMSLGSCGFNQYAARVADPRTYLAIASDILDRWTYPIVADSHSILQQSCYAHAGGGVYISNSVHTGLRTNIHTQVAIDDFTFVDDKATIEHSIIGKNCKIGKDATIEGSIIFDDVEIEDNARVFHSLIYKGTKIKSGAVVNRGSILGGGVIIGKDCVVPPYSRLSLYVQEKEKSKDDEGEEEHEKREEKQSPAGAVDNTGSHAKGADINVATKLSCRDVVGEEGLGILWIPNVQIEDLKSQSLGETILDKIALPIPEVDLCEEEDEEEEEEEEGQEEEEEEEKDDKKKKSTGAAEEEEDFVSEVQAMVREGIEDFRNMHHKVLEMKSFRLTSNKSDVNLVCAFLPVVLDFLASLDFDKDVWASKTHTHRIDYLFSAFLPEDAQDEVTCRQLYDILLSFSRWETLHFFSSKKNPFNGSANFSFLCEFIEHIELFDLQYLPKWYESVCESSPEDKRYLSTDRFNAFVKWLTEEEESD